VTTYVLARPTMRHDKSLVRSAQERIDIERRHTPYYTVDAFVVVLGSNRHARLRLKFRRALGSPSGYFLRTF